MLVYGPNVLKELAKKQIKIVYSTRKDIIKFCQDNKIKYLNKDNSFLNKICNKNHQGVVIEVYDYNYYTFEDIAGDFIVILDHLEDPHNFGAIIRSCVAAGIKSIIIPKDRAVKVTDTVMKTSAGMLNHIKVIMVTNIVETIKKLQKKGYFVYAADMQGNDYKKVNYSAKKVLVIGNEGSGVSFLVKKTSDELIKIPLCNICESLNASVAAGILIFAMRGLE